MCLYIADQSCSKHSWSNKLPGSWSWSHTWPPNWRGPIVGGCQEHGAFQLEYSSLGMCLGFDVLYRIRMNSIQWMNYCMCYIMLHRYSVFRVFCISDIFSSEKETREQSRFRFWLDRLWMVGQGLAQEQTLSRSSRSMFQSDSKIWVPNYSKLLRLY